MTNKDMITVDDKEYAVEELEQEQQEEIMDLIDESFGIYTDPITLYEQDEELWGDFYEDIIFKNISI